MVNSPQHASAALPPGTYLTVPSKLGGGTRIPDRPARNLAFTETAQPGSFYVTDIANSNFQISVTDSNVYYMYCVQSSQTQFNNTVHLPNTATYSRHTT